jgi:hypothetical protein
MPGPGMQMSIPDPQHRELAQVEDAGIAEARMELQMQLVAYESALRILGRELPPSLAAFLR